MKKGTLIPLLFSSITVLFSAILIMGTGFQVRANQEVIDTSLKIPVKAVNVKPGLIMTRPSIQGIEIQVSGSAEQLQRLRGAKLVYELDLSALADGVHTIPILSERIKLPKGISIVKTITPAITVRIDREIKKEVMVVVSTEGEVSPGFRVTGTSASPSKAELSGPQDVLNSIGHITTNPIDISGATESFKKEITLDLVENVKVLFPSEPIIAHIDIEGKMVTRSFKKLPVKGYNATYPFSITPPVISIDVKGPVNVVSALEDNEEFAVYLDLAALKPGVYVRRATIALPVTTALVGVSPEIFTVTVREQ
ncbi:MAG: hypothetical protein LJE94_06920 [Deltaproteobacteria bacterium]|nr:hypothetical protein [Deltaproteobacteria bacterium]